MPKLGAIDPKSFFGAGLCRAQIGHERMVMVTQTKFGSIAIRMAATIAITCVVGNYARAETIDVVQRFDFSSNPVTLTPVDPTIQPQTLTSSQALVFEVNFGQTFVSFANLSIAGEPVPGQSGYFGFRWGNWNGNVWPPSNINDGSIYPAQSSANAAGNWVVGVNYADSSYQMTLSGFGAAVADILDGHFFITYFPCSPYCATGIHYGNPTVTHSAFEVRLTGAELAPVPIPLAGTLFGPTGLVFLTLIAFGFKQRPCNSTSFRNLAVFI